MSQRARHPVLWRAALLIAGIPSAGFAHETWLRLVTENPQPGGVVMLEASTGMEFPAPETAIRLDRIAVSACRQGSDRQPLQTGDPGDNALVLRPSFPQAGVVTAWLELKPKDIELSDDTVAAYFDEIGAGEPLRQTWATQRGRVPWRETYTKHAKTIFAVGQPGTDESWRLPVGMELELVPVSNPLTLRAGAEFDVRLLYRGRPLPDWPVGIMAGGSPERVFATTGNDGDVTFTTPSAGEVLVYAVYLRQSGDDLRWHSEFTTLTLRIH